MNTLYLVPPPTHRAAFLRLKPEEQRRQKFRNLQALRCCPVCARESHAVEDLPKQPFCYDHLVVALQLMEERVQRLAAASRCLVCELVHERCKCPPKATIESHHGMAIPLDVYQEMLSREAAEQL